jgi:hypothetical protein
MDQRGNNFSGLEAEGWTRRFVAKEPRLSEAVDMYRDSGFEVLLEPLPRETGCGTRAGDGEVDECRICFDGYEDQYMIIFTRPTSSDCV